MIVLRGSASSDEWAKVRALGADQPSIRFVDEYLTPTEMVSYYRAADAFISFPATDLFAVSLMEGMACGALPIVAPLPAYEAAFNEINEKGKRWNAVIATDRSTGGCAEALERWWSLKPEDESVTREINARHALADGDFLKNAEQIEDVFKMAQESFRYRMRRGG
jgi:glycosyltransferase involved in cell wall biosynthesis